MDVKNRMVLQALWGVFFLFPVSVCVCMCVCKSNTCINTRKHCKWGATAAVATANNKIKIKYILAIADSFLGSTKLLTSWYKRALTCPNTLHINSIILRYSRLYGTSGKESEAEKNSNITCCFFIFISPSIHSAHQLCAAHIPSIIIYLKKKKTA